MENGKTSDEKLENLEGDLSHRSSSLIKEDCNENELRHLSTYIESGEAAHLSQEHRDYLLRRHGTLSLDPIPSADPADPYNWPTWKKMANLVLIAFHSCMTTFTAAGIIPAFEDIALDLGCSLQRASYFSSMQIAVLGFSPLFWKPISNRYGRRPVWLISTIGSLVCNIGCAKSYSYASLAVCRCLVSFFISPAIAIGSGVVVETFFTKDRGKYMGIWTLLVTLGPPAGPFFMGFVAYHLGFRWIFWIFAVINGVQFILYLFFGPETRYMRSGAKHGQSAFKQEYLNFKRIDPKPIHPMEFIQPTFLAKYTSILIPTISYTVVFGFASVFLTVEIPQIFIPKFGFNPQQIGLQFLGIIIGSIIGELMGGSLSDFWMRRKTKKLSGDARAPPEYRLWLSYFGFLLVIVGLIVFGVRTQQAAPMQWNVTPIVGIAIAACGNQIITTVLVTYAVDSHHEHSSSIGVFVNLVRSTWGFIGPFWFPDMITGIGDSGSGGLMAGIVFVCSVLPIVLLQFWGGRWRETRVQKDGSREGERGD